MTKNDNDDTFREYGLKRKTPTREELELEQRKRSQEVLQKQIEEEKERIQTEIQNELNPLKIEYQKYKDESMSLEKEIKLIKTEIEYEKKRHGELFPFPKLKDDLGGIKGEIERKLERLHRDLKNIQGSLEIVEMKKDSILKEIIYKTEELEKEKEKKPKTFTEYGLKKTSPVLQKEKREIANKLRHGKFLLTQYENELQSRRETTDPERKIGEGQMLGMEIYIDKLKEYISDLEAGKNAEKPDWEESFHEGVKLAEIEKMKEEKSKTGAITVRSHSRSGGKIKVGEYKRSLPKRGSDSIELTNQIIAGEGVLPYSDGAKLKRWSDLEKNIGITVPVLDGHPSPNNGNNGLYSGKEHIVGEAKIKACPRERKKICADIRLDDEEIDKSGYSIGYPYKEIVEPGIHDGIHYDKIQANLKIDHLALTDSPRYPKAKKDMNGAISHDTDIEIMVNNDDVTGDNTTIVYNRLGYDSFAFSIKKSESKMSVNEEDTSETGTKKNELDSKILGMSKEELIAEYTRLKTEKAASDSSNSTIEKLQSELKAERDSKEDYRNKYLGLIEKQIKVNIDSLIKEFGFDQKELEGKSIEWIDGALHAARRISKGLEGEYIEGDSDEDTGGIIDVNCFTFDFDSQKLVPIKKTKMEGDK